MNRHLLGILDVGKTHTRFLTADSQGDVLSEHSRENGHGPRSVGIRQLDLAGIEEWLCGVLSKHPDRDHIDTLIPIAHGAAGALIDGDGAVLAVPDYEDSSFDEVAERYRALRDPFDQTYSPFLPLGLNLGRQLFFLQERAPELWRKARTLLLYPQYWAWRMCGIAASELTSLGCHTDLWRPLQGRSTELAVRAGWQTLLPPLRSARDCLGIVSPEFLHRTGLKAQCRVICGLHDSNASYLAHLAHIPEDPFAVISSGTWTIVMARGADPQCVREPLDMLINVDALGNPVPTARFMGGREYQAIAGEAGMHIEAGIEDANAVLSREALALPSFSQAGGPFAGVRGRTIYADGLDARGQAALASLYVALMSDYLLDLVRFTGTVFVDGPFAHNALYLQTLAELRLRDRICSNETRYPAAVAAAYLANGATCRPVSQRVITASKCLQALERYRKLWREQIQRSGISRNDLPSLGRRPCA